MKKLSRVMVLAFIICSCGSPDRGGGITPDSVGARPLSDTELLSGQYGTAVKAVMRELVNPEDFFATIENRKDPDIVVFHLWHIDAFKKENAHLEGNPGGKCRDVHYSLKDKKITKTLFWQ